MSRRSFTAVAAATLVQLASLTAAEAACKLLRTAADVNNIRRDLDGDYCLTKDINMVGVRNFAPIGDVFSPFTGTFDGRGHAIRNVTIISNKGEVGFFGATSFAQIKRLALLNVNVSATGRVSAGALIGDNYRSTISLVRASGAVRSRLDPCSPCYVGGLIGFTNEGTVSQVYSLVNVSGKAGVTMGGLFGWASSRISFAFAQGQLNGPDFGSVGGLIGELADGTLTQTYAATRINSEAAVGGLVSYVSGAPTIKSSYWDKNTTGTTFSDGGGTGLTTSQLKARLPAGFSPTIWARAAGTYPYLRNLPRPGAAPR